MRKGSERVLVVHGTADVAESAEQGLRLGGFEALLTDDPERASWIAAELRADAVVLDLSITRCDVLDLATALRGHPRTQDLPIVALVDDDARDAVVYAKARGCDAVVSDRDAIARTVERLLTKKRTRRRAA